MLTVQLLPDCPARAGRTDDPPRDQQDQRDVREVVKKMTQEEAMAHMLRRLVDTTVDMDAACLTDYHDPTAEPERWTEYAMVRREAYVAIATYLAAPELPPEAAAAARAEADRDHEEMLLQLGSASFDLQSRLNGYGESVSVLSQNYRLARRQ